jgi:hypothetical protein
LKYFSNVMISCFKSLGVISPDDRQPWKVRFFFYLVVYTNNTRVIMRAGLEKCLLCVCVLFGRYKYLR